MLYVNPEYNDCFITTAINQVKVKPDLVNVFSVPSGVVVIQLGHSASGKVYIFNTTGKLIRQEKIPDSTSQLRMPGTGVYIYRFVSDDGRIQAGKIFIR